LHACAIAEALGMRAVVVPPRAGALSAVGLLVSPRRRDLVRSWPAPLDHDVAGTLAALAAEARDLVGAEAVASTALDCRYAGQSHTLTVPGIEVFHAEHERRNGFARVDAPIEIVACRAWAVGPPALDVADLPVPTRGSARGPCAIAEPDCTVWLPDGWTARPAALGAWVLERAANGPTA
jgi:N-methylhydantoinase A